MNIYDLRDEENYYHLYLEDNNKATVDIWYPTKFETGDKLYLRDTNNIVWIFVAGHIWEYEPQSVNISLETIGREATDKEWKAAADRVMNDYDWDWSNHYPKRNHNDWYVIVDNFIHEYMDATSNYNETDGKPGSRNSDELIAFAKFLVNYPDLRFFQALSTWTGYTIIAMESSEYSGGIKLPGPMHDTFNWEGHTL